MENNDSIKELFKEKLGDFEANVRPEIWSSVSSQLASSTTAVGVLAISIVTKGFVVLSFVAAVTAIIYFSLNRTEPLVKSPKETISKKIAALEIVKEHVQKVETTDIKPRIAFGKEQASLSKKVAKEQTKESEGVLEATNNRNHTTESVQTVIASEIVLESSLAGIKNPETNTVVKPYITEVSSNLNEAINQVYTLELPNVFTPNNDGINDLLVINTEGLTEFSLVVLDQRNKIIYTSQNTNVSWDGLSLSGELVSSGNYVYFITGRDAAGSLVTKHSLLRIER